MARTRCDGAQTRERILDAAARVFAASGFRDATHAEIARLAGVNSALVNYHFTDKETLYAQAWEYARRRTAEKYPLDGGVPENAPAEKRLLARIAVLIRAAADSDAVDSEIWRKELARPTGLLTEIRQKTVVPLRRGIAKAVRDILGKSAPEATVRLATMSIIAQCRVPITPKKEPADSDRFVDTDLETRIEHIGRFSLGGLYALRENFPPSGASASTS